MGEECQEEANSRFFINAFKSYLGNSTTFKNFLSSWTFFPRFLLVEFFLPVLTFKTGTKLTFILVSCAFRCTEGQESVSLSDFDYFFVTMNSFFVNPSPVDLKHLQYAISEKV
jgi:hypothetical protein